MKNNVYETAVKRVTQRMDEVSNRLAENFKGVKPFGSEPIKKGELLQAYEQLGTLDMEYLIQKHGRDKVNSLIADLETYKLRQTNATDKRPIQST